LAAYAELHHWITNLSLTLRGGGNMRGECQIAFLGVKHSGTTSREAGTAVLDYTKAEDRWLISRQTVIIRPATGPAHDHG
jgi:hypothetical protein